ncbi:TPA: tail fiber assembly protein [Enterobacter kobei]|uniref:tail fiber assembly protein n=1 Tax=Enterobacter kobei TaxID=208224 RepID=UPI003B875E86
MDKIYYFDPVGIGFYISPDSSEIPDSATEITFDQYTEFAGVPWPEGMMLGASDTLMPAWIDAPPPTHEAVVVAAEKRKTELLAEAQATIINWQSKLLLGILNEDEKARLIVWLTYIDALNAIDTDTAPDINWPERPAM